jgi:hypothetical protein
MHEKKLIGLAAVLTMMAFAMVPTAAQALEGPEGNKSPVHWQLNGKRTAAGVAIPVISWGTAKLESAAGTITCKNAAAATDVNTAAGQAASEVVMFAAYECRATGGECVPPAEERATAFNLTPDAAPDAGVWPSVTVEEGPANAEEKFRSYDKSGSGPGENPIKVNLECYLGKDNIGSLLFQTGPVLTETGTSTPVIIDGVSPAKLSEFSFEDPNKETGHMYAATEVEPVKEEAVEPTVNYTAGKNNIVDSGKTWAAIVKSGCRVKSEALFPNEIIKEVNSTTEVTLENKVNPTKNFALKTGTFPTKFYCGALTVVPIQATTRGKFKFVGYLDNASTPLVTVGTSVSP